MFILLVLASGFLVLRRTPLWTKDFSHAHLPANHTPRRWGQLAPRFEFPSDVTSQLKSEKHVLALSLLVFLPSYCPASRSNPSSYLLVIVR